MEWIFDRKTKHQKYYLSSFQASIPQPGSSRQKLHIDTQIPDPYLLGQLKQIPFG